MNDSADSDVGGPSKDNVELIIVSDSVTEEEPKQISNLKSEDIAVSNQRDVIQNSTAVSATGNNALPSSSTSHTLNSSCTTQVKRKFNRCPTSKEDLNEVPTDNDLVVKKAKLSESVLIIEEPVTSSQSADTLPESVEDHRTNNQPVPDFIPLVHSTESENKTVKHAHKRPWFGSTNVSLTDVDDGDGVKIIDDPKPNVVSHDDDLQIIHEPEPMVMPLGGLRPVVIDGSNVAIEHGKSRKMFSVKGIQLAIDFFKSRGHEKVVAFVPRFRRNPKQCHKYKTSDVNHLDQLAKQKHVVYTPSRLINNRLITCYDDKFIIKLASINNGIILSNDKFRDIKKKNPEFTDVINQKTLNFKFQGDQFIVDDRPHHEQGQSLDTFSRFTIT